VRFSFSSSPSSFAKATEDKKTLRTPSSAGVVPVLLISLYANNPNCQEISKNSLRMIKRPCLSTLPV
jgi:hypothetical protein